MDTEHNFVFKYNYRKIFATQVEPKLVGNNLTVRNRRILVTRMVPKAHATIPVVMPTGSGH